MQPRSVNPYLAEIDAAANNAHAQLSPGAQEALRKAGAPVPQAQPDAVPQRISSPGPSPRPISMGSQQPMSEEMPNGQPAMTAAAHTPAPIKPVPLSPEGQAQAGELNRITAPPPSDPALIHTHANTGASGIQQIHSPWARIPLQIAEAVGAGFAPGLTSAIPGTELHHQALIGGRENALKQQQGIREEEEKAGTAAATQQHLEAESENQLAQSTRERQAPHPTITTDKGIMQWNPQTGRFDIPAGNAPTKEEMEGKTITTDQGIMQWNPATKSYDIKAGDSPEKEAADKTLQDTDGVWYKVGKDNQAIPITLNGQPFKGKTANAAGDDFSQFYQKWLKEKGVPDSASNEKKARTEWASSTQAPERPPQALMIGPNGTAMVVRPGTAVPTGSMTPGGLSTENETPAQVRSRQAQAEVIKTAGDQLIASIERNRGKLGNIDSYWNKFTNGSPIADPETAALMAQLSSFAALQPALHGFRGAQALAEFEKVIGGVPKNPDALEAAIKAIQGTAGIVANNGKGGGSGAVPEVKTQAEFDALPKGTTYMEDGKKYRKP